MNKLFMLISALLLLGVIIIYSFNNKEKYILSDEFEYYTTRLKNKITSKYTIPYPIYFINMDKNADRLENMMNQKEYVNAEMIRVRAFNGNMIKNKEQDTVDDISFVNHYTDMNLPEIGCCLSHLIAIETAWRNGDEIAMIVEDDLSFLSVGVIPPLEDIVSNSPVDWNIIQLLSVNLPDDDSGEIKYIKREYPSSFYYSTCCYIINREGMEKILNIVKPDNAYHIKPIRKATPKENSHRSYIDIYKGKSSFPPYGASDYYIYDIVNTYTTSISLFILNSGLDSTIHMDHDYDNMNKNLKMTKRLLDRYG